MRRLHRKKQSTPARTALLTLIAVAVLGVTASSYGYQETSAQRVIVAEFKDASPLVEGNEVKVNGVKVGTISSMSIVDGIARVVMEVGPETPTMHADAGAQVRPVSLLGERFVDLDPGTASQPVLDARTPIPSGRTGQATDLDQVLNTVDEPTGEKLAALVAVLGGGLQGNGQNVDQAVKALAPALNRTDELARVLRQQNGTLNSLVDSLEPVSQSLAADDGRKVDQLVGSTRDLLGTTAANQAAFESVLNELPGTVTEARKTLAQLAGTAETTTPTLRAMRPTTENLTEISQELNRFADSADPALLAADPVLERAQTLVTEARPVAEQLHQMGPSVTNSAKALEPTVAELTGNMTTVMEFFKGWALATNSKDGLAHYFRAGLVITPYSATGLLPGLGGDAGVGGEPPPPTTNPGGQPVQPEPPGGLPKLPLGPGGLPVPPSGLLAPQPSQDGGQTGLSQEQERSALGFLLGGE